MIALANKCHLSAILFRVTLNWKWNRMWHQPNCVEDNLFVAYSVYLQIKVFHRDGIFHINNYSHDAIVKYSQRHKADGCELSYGASDPCDGRELLGENGGVKYCCMERKSSVSDLHLFFLSHPIAIDLKVEVIGTKPGKQGLMVSPCISLMTMPLFIADGLGPDDWGMLINIIHMFMYTDIYVEHNTIIIITTILQYLLPKGKILMHQTYGRILCQNMPDNE